MKHTGEPVAATVYSSMLSTLFTHQQKLFIRILYVCTHETLNFITTLFYYRRQGIFL